jgi:hypothetical protein
VRLSPITSLGIGLAAFSLALTGCATAEPEAAPAASSTPTPTPTPTPTVEPIVIGPTEMPPVVFGGDCEEVLSADEVTTILGAESTIEELPPALGKFADQNAGALKCSWTTDGAGLDVTLITRGALGSAVFPAEVSARYFEDCDGWFCSWQGEEDGLWMLFTFTREGMSQAEVEAGGEALAPIVGANYAESGSEPWVRDRTGWWPALDCGQIAVAVGAQAGAELSGERWDSLEGPDPGYLMAAEGTGEAHCTLYDEAGDIVGFVTTNPGLGAPPIWPDSEPVELGAPGITAVTDGATGSLTLYAMSDGVNRVHVQSSGSSVGTPEQFAVAVAAAAASDFQ